MNRRNPVKTRTGNAVVVAGLNPDPFRYLTQLLPVARSQRSQQERLRPVVDVFPARFDPLADFDSERDSPNPLPAPVVDSSLALHLESLPSCPRTSRACAVVLSGAQENYKRGRDRIEKKNFSYVGFPDSPHFDSGLVRLGRPN